MKYLQGELIRCLRDISDGTTWKDREDCRAGVQTVRYKCDQTDLPRVNLMKGLKFIPHPRCVGTLYTTVISLDQRYLPSACVKHRIHRVYE